MAINRRELFQVLGVPIVLGVMGSGSEKVEDKAPRDTDDREWDGWLDSYDKDMMHLD